MQLNNIIEYFRLNAKDIVSYTLVGLLTVVGFVISFGLVSLLLAAAAIKFGLFSLLIIPFLVGCFFLGKWIIENDH